MSVDVCVQGSSVELPKNGPFWHEIREVAVPDIVHVTTEFNSLVKVSNVTLNLPTLCRFHVNF